MNNDIKRNLDPLDPLTEITKSGQAFSSSIALERFIWVMMGFFFLGAVTTSITREIRHNWFENKSFLSILKSLRGQDKLSDEDK